MNYRLLMFDLDGTLLDTLDDLRAAVNRALASHRLPPRSRDEIRCFVGNGMRLLCRRSLLAAQGLRGDAALLDTAPDPAPQLMQAVFDEFYAYYQTHAAELTYPYAGITELLVKLKEAGVPAAVVSNKADPAVQRLCAHYFPGLITFAAGERQGCRRKPAPDLPHLVLETLQVPSEQALYIGDSEVDVLTAKNAGLDCLGVTWGFRSAAQLTAAGATVLVDSPAALWKRLER